MPPDGPAAAGRETRMGTPVTLIIGNAINADTAASVRAGARTAARYGFGDPANSPPIDSEWAFIWHGGDDLGGGPEWRVRAEDWRASVCEDVAGGLQFSRPELAPAARATRLAAARSRREVQRAERDAVRTAADFRRLAEWRNLIAEFEA